MKKSSFRVNPCHHCGSSWHSAWKCPHIANKPLKKEGDKARKKRQSTANKWFKANPPDEHGDWICYLQISELCPKKLNRQLITLEHVKSKVRHPELKYDINNIKPSCSFCNYLKGSRDLEELARIWPHLLRYLD